MCSSDELKKPFYQVAQFDSRNLLQLGKALGIKPLEQEAQYNIKNPGHAISTAGEYALGGYLGSLLGAGAGAGEAGVGAGTTGAAALDYGAETAAQQVAAEQALQAAADSGISAAPVIDRSLNSIPVKDLSTQAGLLDKARLAFSSGSSTGKGGLLAAQLGMKMLQPQQPQMPMSPPPRQGSVEPLPNPYQSGPFGQYGNSLGIYGLTEEQKRRLRAQGVQI